MSSPTKLSGNKKRILWSVDPNQDPQEAKNIIVELKTWAKRLNCDVQPVSVFSDSALSFPVDLTTLWTKGIEKFAYESVNQYLKKTRVKGFLPPHVVFSKTLSNRKMAAELSAYAVQVNASLIFANTRAKRTLNPLRLGGFAETLVATSSVPVLLLNQSAAPSSQIPSILFPTNFSSESKVALTLLEPWAQSFKSKIVIFNQVEIPNNYEGLTPEYFLPISWAALLESTEKGRKTTAKHLVNNLKERGIDSEAIVQRQKKSINVDILNVADKKNINLIALSSHGGPLSQALLGSIARDVLLEAKCPVLIFHRPKAAQKPKTLAKQPPVKKISRRKELPSETTARY